MNATRRRALAALRNGPPVFACEVGAPVERGGGARRSPRSSTDNGVARRAGQPRRFVLRSETTYEHARPLSVTKALRTVSGYSDVAIRWARFDPSDYPAAALDYAGRSWRLRATDEYNSLALFGQLASQACVLGAPLDWASAFSKIVSDEIRHADICMRMARALGNDAPPEVAQEALTCRGGEEHSLAARLRVQIIAASCIGETLSGRLFRRCLRNATVPLAREVLRAILVDEAFHSSFGWEAAAMLMRGEGQRFERERRDLARVLPALFAQYRRLCRAEAGVAAAYAAPEVPAGAPCNFGTLTSAGYARVFYEGMRDDVVPGLVAIGLPEAAAAFERFV